MAEKKTLWLYDQLGGLVSAEPEYVSGPRVDLHLDPDEGMTGAQLVTLLPGVPATLGADEWTIRLDVRELPDRDVQRVADAILAVLMPGSIGR